MNLKSIILFSLLVFSYILLGQNRIIPSPTEYIESGGKLYLNKKINFNSNSIPKAVHDFFKEKLNELFQVELIDSKRNGDIQFTRNESLSSSYNISITEKIKVEYKSDEAAFYAVTSLLQLINSTEFGVSFMKCALNDEPRFQWRGLHLDVARHFYTIDEVKRYIDLMSLYKFNVFHWHLTDDQGWRIEINRYPKLTEIGAYRDSTIMGHYNDEPRKYEVEKYGGFYTQEQIKEVVQYASDRYITVVPEIEMPGHARAAIAAYPELSCTGDKLPVPGLWGVFDDIFCSKKETIDFMKGVLTEVLELFPSEYIHIGGDEAPKTRWEKCVNCRKVMAENHLESEHELQSYFIKQIDAFLTEKGRKLIGWDEILEGGLSPNAAVMSWRGEEGGIEAAKQKHEVVMSPTTYCYFDYYQSGSSFEPLSIGGFLPLEKVYHYSPVPKEMSAENQSYVLGGQANLWTEYISTFEQVEYMVYPRALALIQSLWCVNKPNYDAFFQTFSVTQEDYLKLLDVNYSSSVYLPELRVSRIENGVEYEFVTKKNEGLYLTQGISHIDKYDGVYIIKEVEGNSVKVSRLDTLIDNRFDIQLKSEKVVGEINYEFTNHKGLGVPIKLITKPHPKYSNGGDLTLVNGIKGTRPWKGDQWLGFNEEFIELVIDVSKLDTIHSITIGFLDAKGSWIYLPDSIRICFEELDGTISFSDMTKINEEYQEFKLNEKTDKLRLLIYPTKEIPQGAEGAGNVPWTFIDEIIIK